MGSNNLTDIFKLLEEARDNNIIVSFKDGDVLLNFQSGRVIDADFLRKLREHKSDLIEYFINRDNFYANKRYLINEKINKLDTPYCALSYSQERLWVIDQLEGTDQYHIPLVLSLSGDLDVLILEKAFKAVIDRHEVLRTIIFEKDGIPYQKVISIDSWKLNKIPWINEKQTVSVNEKALISKPFDLSVDYMLRADLARTGVKDYLLIVTIHHIASDGFSMPILTNELIKFYNAFLENKPYPFLELPLQYADFAFWQRENLNKTVLDPMIEFWKMKLQGFKSLSLPYDYPRPFLQSKNGAHHKFKLNPELTLKVKALSQKLGATMYMTLLGIFKILLFKYSGQDDICVGSPISGRIHKDLEGLVGLFVNTIVIRSNLENNPAFESFLMQLKSNVIEAFDYQEVPFEKVVEELVKDRDLGKHPIFQVMFVYNKNNPALTTSELLHLKSTFEAYEHNTSKFDLTLIVFEGESELQCEIEYCTALFSNKTIENMAVHMINLLEFVVQYPESPIEEIDITDPKERFNLISGFNGQKINYSIDKNLVTLFEDQVLRTPANIALKYGDEQITYLEVNNRANQLASYLKSKGVTGNVMIPLCLERSNEMIICILGILKAGAAYVPIDPAYPIERIIYILNDINSEFLICNLSIEQSLNSLSSVKTVIIYSDKLKEISKYPEENIGVPILLENLAYVIYTSGSTGQPKGVMIEHGNVVELMITKDSVFDFNQNDVWTFFHSFCFDFSVWELFGALLFGGKLIIVSSLNFIDTFSLVKLLKNEGVTVLNQTPSAFYAFQDDYIANCKTSSIRFLIFGGESLNIGRIKPWYNKFKNCKIINMYGITECTVFATCKIIDDKTINQSLNLIGLPIPMSKVYVLDKYLKVSPTGLIGELYIGGKGLARGYLNKDDLTLERFISSPFIPGEKIYRTGDLGRWLSNGTLEYNGRIDNQVKIRGYRIELGEIENILQAHYAVHSALVVTRTNSAKEKELVAYLVFGHSCNISEIREYIKSKLPAYMVPEYYVEVDSIPLTKNGKVDILSLPEVAENAIRSDDEFLMPGSQMEKQLLEVYAAALGIEEEKISVNDNFFDLGGNSIKAIRLAGLVNQISELNISGLLIFKYPNISSLANYILELKKSRQY